MDTFSIPDLYRYLLAVSQVMTHTGAGNPAWAAAGAAIVMAESGGNTKARNPRSGDYTSGPGAGTHDMGMWQINSSHLGTTFLSGSDGQTSTLTEDACYDPGLSSAYAWALSHGGTNWSPWSTWGTKAYSDALQQVNAHKSDPGSADTTAGAGISSLAGDTGSAVGGAVKDALGSVLGGVAAKFATGFVNTMLVLGGGVLILGGLFLAKGIVTDSAPQNVKDIGSYIGMAKFLGAAA